MRMTRERLAELKVVHDDVGLGMDSKTDDLIDDLIAHAEATIDQPEKIQPREWVKCPICGEPDMSKTPDGNYGFTIDCVNLNCGSNGGSNFNSMFGKPESLPVALSEGLSRSEVAVRFAIAIVQSTPVSAQAIVLGNPTTIAGQAIELTDALLAQLSAKPEQETKE